MLSGQSKKTAWTETADFRTKATLGVALAAVTLLLPIALVNLFTDRIYVAMGSLYIVCMLIANVVAISQGRDHQKLTLYGLIPAGMIFMAGVFLQDGIVGTLWCYPSIIASYCMLSEKRAWSATAIILGVALPMVWLTLPAAYAYRVTATLLAVSLFSGILVRVIDTQHNRLQEQINRDPLTGLLNRLSIKRKLQTAISDYKNGGQRSSLLAIDVDHFKRINDTFGHEQGDAALCKLAELLVENLRTEDACFRTGGEEFLVLLHGMCEKEAFGVAERIRHLLEVSEIISGHAVTASIGIATYAADESWTHWVKRADHGLYSAKRAGRNRVAIAGTANQASVSVLRNANNGLNADAT